MEEDAEELLEIKMKINDKTVLLFLISSTIGCGISILLAALYLNSLILVVYGIVFGLTLGFIGDYFILITHPLYTTTIVKKPSDQSNDLETYPSVMKLT